MGTHELMENVEHELNIALVVMPMDYAWIVRRDLLDLHMEQLDIARPGTTFYKITFEMPVTIPV